MNFLISKTTIVFLTYLLTLHFCISESQITNTEKTSIRVTKSPATLNASAFVSVSHGLTKSPEALNASRFVSVSRGYNDAKNSSQNYNRKRSNILPLNTVSQDWKNNSSGEKLFVNKEEEKNKTPKNTFYLDENNFKFKRENFLLNNHNKPKLNLEIKSNESNSSKPPLQFRSIAEQRFLNSKTLEPRFKLDSQLVTKGNEDLSKEFKDNKADLVDSYTGNTIPSPKPSFTIQSEKNTSYSPRKDTKSPLTGKMIFSKLVNPQGEGRDILKISKNSSYNNSNRQARQLENNNKSDTSVAYFINSKPPSLKTKESKYEDKISDLNSFKKLGTSENHSQTQTLSKVSQDKREDLGYSEYDPHKFYPVCAISPSESPTTSYIPEHISHHSDKLDTYSQSVPQRTNIDESLSNDLFENKRNFAPINFVEGSDKTTIVPRDFLIPNKFKPKPNYLYQEPTLDLIYPNNLGTNYLALLSSLTGLNPMSNIQSITPEIFTPHGQDYNQQNSNPFSNFIRGRNIFPRTNIDYLSNPFSVNYDVKDDLQNNPNHFYFAPRYPPLSQSSHSKTSVEGVEEDAIKTEENVNSKIN
ncbi:UNVERIFIED_CONTAM: hypothetical protein RMT77_002591 [Armadillidium vulgare]